MTRPNLAIAKLQRIQELWVELGRAKLNSPEYQEIMQSIRSLSAEYQALIAAPQKGEESK
jgi:hypothetical protein